MHKHIKSKLLSAMFWCAIAATLYFSTPRSVTHPVDILKVLDNACPGEHVDSFLAKIPRKMVPGKFRLKPMDEAESIAVCRDHERTYLDASQGPPANVLAFSVESNTCQRVCGRIFGDTYFYNVAVFFTEENKLCGCSLKVSSSAPWRLSKDPGIHCWQPSWYVKGPKPNVSGEQ